MPIKIRFQSSAITSVRFVLIIRFHIQETVVYAELAAFSRDTAEDERG